MRKPKISVLGASNYDLVNYIRTYPKPGETIHGLKFHTSCGGKGANQAVMAAKLGAEVSLITKIGNDIFGKAMLKNLLDMGISNKHIYISEKTHSGIATIMVGEDGNNSIVVIPGACSEITDEEFAKAEKTIASSDIFICQLEIPLDINLKAMRTAAKNNVRTIFNPSPCPENIPSEMLSLCTLLCLNEIETEQLTGTQNPEKAAKELICKGPREILITLGTKGAFYFSENEKFFVAAEKVNAVDTTGAGDCFLGTFAYFYANGETASSAVKKACHAAALSVCSQGAQSSYPSAEEVKG
ncbi:MAG: ribokinase [Lentisphaerae bacterium GWF2_44_16]|nr:MAG: ribokinase [Lentisphaerae bacterium GWF2_44_16]